MSGKCLRLRAVIIFELCNLAELLCFECKCVLFLFLFEVLLYYIILCTMGTLNSCTQFEYSLSYILLLYL